MAAPLETITTVSGRRCTRSIRSDASTITPLISSTTLSSAAAVTSINETPPAEETLIRSSEPIPTLSIVPPPPQDTNSDPETEIQSTSSPPSSPSEQPPEENPPPVETPPNTPGDEESEDEPPSAPILTPVPGTPPVVLDTTTLIPGTIQTPVAISSQSALPIVQPIVAAVVAPSPQPAFSTAVVPNRLGDTPKNGGPSPIPVSDSVSSDISSSLVVSVPSSISNSNLLSTVVTSTSSTIAPTSGADGIPNLNGPESNESSGPSMAPIAGGVVGGLVGIALIAGLFFLFFKRRKDGGRTLPWQRQRTEKSHANDGDADEPSLVQRLKEKIWTFFALFTGKTSERASSHPSTRSNRRSSTWSDVPNSPTLARSRSMSAPAETFRRGGLPGFVAGFKSRTGSRKQTARTGHPSPESETSRYSTDTDNPFLDPPPPAHLHIRNPDYPAPLNFNRNTSSQGLANQQRGPLSPQIRTTHIPLPIPSRNPFADQTTTPDYLRKSHHSRSQSLHTALHSHPPASDPPPCPINSNPFADPPPPTTTTPPQPSATATPPTKFSSITPPTKHTRVPSSARSSLSALIFQNNNTATPSARSSANVMGTPFMNTGGGVRKSDPFDLENVVGNMGTVPRKEVRERMSPGDKRRSSSATRWGVRTGTAK